MDLLDTEALPICDRRCVLKRGVLKKRCRLQYKEFDFVLLSDMLVYGHSSSVALLPELGGLVRGGGGGGGAGQRGSATVRDGGAAPMQRKFSRSSSMLSVTAHSPLGSGSGAAGAAAAFARSASAPKFALSRSIRLTQLALADAGDDEDVRIVIASPKRQFEIVAGSPDEKKQWLSASESAQGDAFAAIGGDGAGALGLVMTDDSEEEDDEYDEDDDEGDGGESLEEEEELLCEDVGTL